MKTMIKPTVPFLLSTVLTGICCHCSGMSRPDLIVAIVVAAIVSGSVAFGTFVRAHRVRLRHKQALMRTLVVFSTSLILGSVAWSQNASHFRRADISRNDARMSELARVREFRCDYELARFAQGTLLIAEVFRDGKCTERFRLARAKYDQSKREVKGTISIGWQRDANNLVCVHDNGDSHGPWTSSAHLAEFIPEDAFYFADSWPEKRKPDGSDVDVELYPVLGLCGQRSHKIRYPEAADTQSFLTSCASAGARDMVVIYLYFSPLDEEPTLKFTN